MRTRNSKHIQVKNMDHIKQVQQPTKHNHRTMTRVIVCSSEKTDHYHTLWASSITTAHTRLHKSGFFRASFHLVWDRALGDMSCTRNATLSSKDFLLTTLLFLEPQMITACMDTTVPQIPDPIYHQSNMWRHDDGTTSLLTTDQTTLVVEEERKYLKADTFAEATWQTNNDILSAGTA